MSAILPLVDTLGAAARALRKHAEPVGPLHAYWDLIHDLEAWAARERTAGGATPVWIEERELTVERLAALLEECPCFDDEHRPDVAKWLLPRLGASPAAAPTEQGDILASAAIAAQRRGFERLCFTCLEGFNGATCPRCAATQATEPAGILRPGNLCPDHGEPLMLLCAQCKVSAGALTRSPSEGAIEAAYTAYQDAAAEEGATCESCLRAALPAAYAVDSPIGAPTAAMIAAARRAEHAYANWWQHQDSGRADDALREAMLALRAALAAQGTP